MNQSVESLLDIESQKFAENVSQFLSSVFDNIPPVIVERLDNRIVIRTSKGVPLKASGTELAKLDISIRCRVDASRLYLAVEKSTMKLTALLDRAPIIRWEYERDAHSKPTAHIHVHAHRGALSHILSQCGHENPHGMESLHIPVGGARFRPSIEDVVEFLIDDCGLDGKPNWQEAVRRGRADYRTFQAKTVVRDMPEIAAEALKRLGYSVEPPPGGHPPPSEKALHKP
ncbi:hypothetical protein ACOBQX_14380 [Actinokineospora sp. G85]|uniref:hypothetical protein n=1 Tax=Actinokineospora sp. G85 TaxID=3406626 RepID=UPI003C749550